MEVLAYAAPLSLVLAAFIADRVPTAAFHVGRIATAGALLLSLMAAVTVALSGAGTRSAGLSIRLDALSVIMFWLVAFLGLLLIQFSRNYLDGDERQHVFLSRLYLTLGAVIFFVLAGNLVQLTLGWIAMSLALHQLLVFYPERPRAVIAARKKFIVARAGDVCLIVAALLFANAYETTDLVALSEAAASGSVPMAASFAAVLVAVAAILKSAMFPLHGWLLEVMETPTPVSALLHAGLLNAGTFLVVRLGDVIFISTPALILLIVMGGFTAMFASSAMITQSSVKVSLAYSSAAHMGFMLMLCGFGAHPVAIMHLVAHSFYKAHAFLSSGSIVEYAQNTGSVKLNKAPHPLVMVASIATALLIFVLIGGVLLGIDLTKHPGETALGVIFIVAVSTLLVRGTGAPLMVMARTALCAAGVTLAFFTLELIGAWLLGDAVAYFPQPDTATLVVMVGMVIAFAAVTILGALLPVFQNTPAWRTGYVHLKNGFYANALFDRLVTR
jgi:NAD(P)H-quinone oxidoreductase subunit 5